MATVTSYTAARMKEIEDSAIVGGSIVGGDLILVRFDAEEINAGSVIGSEGPEGPTGPTSIIVCTSLTRPSTGLFEGLEIYETDTNRYLAYNGSGWEQTGFLWDPPFARLRHLTAQTILTATWTALNYSIEDYDSNAMHSGGDNTRITCVKDGIYHFEGNISFAASATGTRGIGFRKNGSGSGPTEGRVLVRASDSVSTSLHISTDISMVVSDYLQVMAFQDTGGNLDTAFGEGTQSFSGRWVARTSA